MSDPVRPRGIILAMCGVPILAWLVQWSDVLVGGTMMAGPFPPLCAFMMWAILLLLNAVWVKSRRKSLLSRAELLVILSAWIAANMVVGRGIVHPFLSSLAGITYYARNGLVGRAIATYMPDWLAVTSQTVSRNFYEGHNERTPWESWMRPLQTWSLFFVPLLTTNICLCGLFERVWVRSERLAYPLVALPLEALQVETERQLPAGFQIAFRFGLAVPLLLHGFGIMHAYVPLIPCVPFFNDVSGLLTTPPWTAAAPIYVNFYPLLIGLSFLAPTDVTFSVWFFLLLNKAELVTTVAGGWSDTATGGTSSAMPYLEEQSAGAYVMLGVVLVWNARRHLSRIGRRMFDFRWTRRRRPVKPEIEAVEANKAVGAAEVTDIADEYRLMAWGFCLGVVGLLAWGIWIGMPTWFTISYFGFYLLVVLVLSRLMAEGGVSWILAPILPEKLILSLVGSAGLSPVDVTRMSLYAQHLRDTRQMLAPAVAETGKLRDAAGYSTRYFYGLLLAAALLALVCGGAFALPMFYRYGALALAPNSDGLQMSTNVIPRTGVILATDRLAHAVRPSFNSLCALLVGALVTYLLSVMRMRFLWWPLHPLGYALTGTLQVGYANKMLLSIFLGWLFKVVTLRLAGARGFRFLRGAALGLIFGDLLVGCLLKVMDAALGPSGYAMF